MLINSTTMAKQKHNNRFFGLIEQYSMQIFPDMLFAALFYKNKIPACNESLGFSSKSLFIIIKLCLSLYIVMAIPQSTVVVQVCGSFNPRKSVALVNKELNIQFALNTKAATKSIFPS